GPYGQAEQGAGKAGKAATPPAGKKREQGAHGGAVSYMGCPDEPRLLVGVEMLAEAKPFGQPESDEPGRQGLEPFARLLSVDAQHGPGHGQGGDGAGYDSADDFFHESKINSGGLMGHSIAQGSGGPQDDRAFVVDGPVPARIGRQHLADHGPGHGRGVEPDACQPMAQGLARIVEAGQGDVTGYGHATRPKPRKAGH